MPGEENTETTATQRTPDLTPKERKAAELYNAVAAEYELPKGSPHATKVSKWIDALSSDAQFNFGSYAECFISENSCENVHQGKEDEAFS